MSRPVDFKGDLLDLRKGIVRLGPHPSPLSMRISLAQFVFTLIAVLDKETSDAAVAAYHFCVFVQEDVERMMDAGNHSAHMWSRVRTPIVKLIHICINWRRLSLEFLAIAKRRKMGKSRANKLVYWRCSFWNWNDRKWTFLVLKMKMNEWNTKQLWPNPGKILLGNFSLVEISVLFLAEVAESFCKHW